MERRDAGIPLVRVAVGLIGLVVGVAIGVGLGTWLSWDPADWRYILYNVVMLSAVVLFIVMPAMRPRGPRIEGG